MNILYDYQTFEAQKFGGISRYFFEIIPRIARTSGMNVSVFQGLHINRYGLESVRSDFRGFFGVRRPQIRKTGRAFSVVNRILFQKFAVKSRPDTYHFTYYDDPFPVLRVKRIVTVHDMIHEMFPDEFPRDRTAERKKLAVARADRIIAVSESTKRDLVRILHTPPEKIQVIYHGNSLRAPSGRPALRESPYVLFVGLRSGYKNFQRALEAFSRSDRLKGDFYFVCFGGPPFHSNELAHIRALDLQGRVSHSSGPDSLLASLYEHAVFFICPSLYEGFGLPVLEAMHYGCPVLCANASSLPEVAGKAARFFDPQDVESITNAMEDVAYSTDKRQALGEAGRIQEAKFSWDRCAKETMECYRN